MCPFRNTALNKLEDKTAFSERQMHIHWSGIFLKIN